jgi:Fic family protein
MNKSGVHQHQPGVHAKRKTRSDAHSARERATKKVLIELSQGQVRQVIRAASDGSSIAVLLSGIEDARTALATAPEQLEDPRLSRSLLSGLLLLACLPADGSFLRNKDLALMLGMSNSTAHRYLQTLVEVGLVERDPDRRGYRLAQ